MSSLIWKFSLFFSSLYLSSNFFISNDNSPHRGYNIGVRLIEDFLARSNIGRCQDFRETADVIAKVSGKFQTGQSVDVSQDGGRKMEKEIRGLK